MYVTSRRSCETPALVVPDAISDPSSAGCGTGTSNGRPAAAARRIASFSASSSARDSPWRATLNTNRRPSLVLDEVVPVLVAAELAHDRSPGRGRRRRTASSVGAASWREGSRRRRAAIARCPAVKRVRRRVATRCRTGSGAQGLSPPGVAVSWARARHGRPHALTARWTPADARTSQRSRAAGHPACIGLMHTHGVTPRRSLVSVGTAFHPRTAPLNRKMQWREWAGYYASSVYADFHDIEYNAIREAAAVIDVSPLYKYRLTGPDVIALVDRVITRDATKLKVGQVYYTPWCDEHGKVIDDGTVHRVAEHELRWTAADPQYRWLTQNAAGLDVTIEDVTEELAALALQGPFSRAVLEAATGEDFADLRYFRRRAATIAGTRDRRQPHRLHRRPRLRAVDPGRRGADAVWDVAVRRRHGVRDPPGGDARARRHAPRGRAHPARGGLHVRPPRDEPGAELQPVRDRPRQARDASTRRTTSAGARSRPSRPRAARRAASSGLQLDWYDIERLYDDQGLPPAISPDRRSLAGPGLRRREAGRQGDVARLEPDPQAGDRARVGAAALRAGRDEARRSSGRSRAAAAGSARRSWSCRSSTSTRKRA